MSKTPMQTQADGLNTKAGDGLHCCRRPSLATRVSALAAALAAAALGPATDSQQPEQTWCP
jgi:hypothetical protein